MVAWSWTGKEVSGKDDRYLVVVNLSDSAVQAHVHPPWDDIGEETWQLTDTLSGVSYDRPGNEILAEDSTWEWSRGTVICSSAGGRAPVWPAIT